MPTWIILMRKSIFFVLLVSLINLCVWSADSNDGTPGTNGVLPFLPDSFKKKCGNFRDYKSNLSAINCNNILLSYYCISERPFGAERDIICGNHDRGFWLDNGLKNGHEIISRKNPFEQQRELEKLNQGMQNYSNVSANWRREPVLPR